MGSNSLKWIKTRANVSEKALDGQSKDESTKEVTLRHQQLYHYSRFLFEAVEFYGQRMTP